MPNPVSQLAWDAVRRTKANQQFDPAVDPTSSHWLQKFDLGVNGIRILWGRIVGCVPFLNLYKVQTTGLPVMLCTMGGSTSFQPIGVSDYGMLVPNTAVFYALYPDDTVGRIVCVDVEYSLNSTGSQPDFISQAGRAGMAVDTAHQTPVLMGVNGNVQNFNAGRPYDQTTAGEKGWMGSTGTCIHLDDFMAFLRADEETGLWAFWHDQLVRLSGHNLQLWSACREREDKDSYGQVDSVEGYTPYYWEALGAWSLANNSLRNVADSAWQLDPTQQAYSSVEPAIDAQQAFFRLRDFYGYLGQGHKRLLQLQPQTAQSDVQTYPDQGNIYPSVYEENLSLTGRKSIRTAHEYMIVKRLPNPSPKQFRLQEDVNADTPENYKAAGTLGNGPDHIVQGDLTVNGTDDPAAVRAAGFTDTQTYVFNWESLHPFSYAVNTWDIPNESDLTYVASIPTPVFSELASSFNMSAPAAVPLTVDARYGTVNYYPNESYFVLLEDGGVKIGCGFGAEITAVNGHIFIDAPGDVTIRTGRNFNVLAGQDVCITGRNSVDIVANNKDLRLSGNHGVYILGGNDGCGGVLIESRAVGVNIDFGDNVGEDVTLGGVIIKARTSMFGVCAPLQQFTAVNTATEAEWAGTTPPTPSMLFDATGGRVRYSSDFFERFINSAALDIWQGGAVVNEYWSDIANIGTGLAVNGNLTVTGCAVIDMSVETPYGHFYSAKAALSGGQVGVLSGAPQTAAINTLTQVVNRAAAANAIGAQEYAHFQALEQPICNAEFSYRVARQYHTTDFTMFESRWQQMNRLSGAEPGGVWSINPVITAEAVDTYPWPGEPWVDGTNFRTLDLSLVTPDTGLAIDREDGAYDNATFQTPVQLVLNNNLSTIFN